MTTMLCKNNHQGQSPFVAAEEEASHLTLEDASKMLSDDKKRYNLPVDPVESSSSSDNTTLDFHVAIFGLMAGVVFGFILAMKMSHAAAESSSSSSSSSLYLHKPIMPQPSPSQPFNEEFCQRSDHVSSSVADPSAWRSSSCPQNETTTAATTTTTTTKNVFSESSGAGSGGGAISDYYQSLLEEMEPPRYSIDGLIYSMYHTFLGSW
ncbi:unnamed protein product [Cylindrotheca closterium]|uniref:Uncharacterized protein n=1 Tax=Cylindrotheca closterium TaxID=2856 RepID=A0AAD2FWD0_9STRA|nr:unnamed protein product [Cylindrotheca closterium]